MNTNKKFFIAKVMADTSTYLVQLMDETFLYGKEVIIRSEQGLLFAHITSFPFSDRTNFTNHSKADFVRYATDDDKTLQIEVEAQAKLIKKEVSGLSKELSLNMNITHVLATLDSKSLTICYTAKGRVDFRQLLKILRTRLSERVILRQIGKKQRFESFHIDERLPMNTHFR